MFHVFVGVLLVSQQEYVIVIWRCLDTGLQGAALGAVAQQHQTGGDMPADELEGFDQ